MMKKNNEELKTLKEKVEILDKKLDLVIKLVCSLDRSLNSTEGWLGIEIKMAKLNLLTEFGRLRNYLYEIQQEKNSC